MPKYAISYVCSQPYETIEDLETVDAPDHESARSYAEGQLNVVELDDEGSPVEE